MKEKLYEQFTTEVLPKVQEGLMITKDYAFDLFERYISYLIMIDSISVIAFGLLLILPIPIMYIAHKIEKKAHQYNKGFAYFVGGMISFLILFTNLLFLSESVKNLVKDIYIPEIRVMEELNIIGDNV